MRRGIHSSFSDTFVLNPSAPLTSGGSLDLANGQVGLFIDKGTARGAKSVANVTDFKNTKYFLGVGTGVEGDGAGMTSKDMRTVQFKPADVLEVTYGKATPATQAVVFIGYNGINDDSLDLNVGESKMLHITLEGEALAYYGLKKGMKHLAFPLYAPIEGADCEDTCATTNCMERTLELIKIMKAHELREGVKLGDLVKISPVISCFDDLAATTTAAFFTIEVCDAGDAPALGLVQAQVAGYRVERVARNGQISTYQVVVTDGSGTPADYEVWEANLKTNCGGDCPAGYTLSEGGYLYSVALDDAGSDVSATLLNGFTLITETAGEIEAVSVGAADASRTAGTYNGVTGTASASGAGAVLDVVVDGAGAATVTIDTVGADYVVGETITIADGDLGSGGAADLVVTVTATVTLVTSVTRTGEEYGVGKYAIVSETELTDAEIAELVASDATLKIDPDFVVVDDVCIKDALDTISWAANGTCDISEVQYVIALADNDCDGTPTSRLAELQANYPQLVITEGEEESDSSDCRRKYYTTVPTNIVCQECYPEAFEAKAPAPFEFSEWTQVPAAEVDETDCKCGIRFEAIEFEYCPDKKIADRVATIVGQTEIYVSAGDLDSHLIGYKFRNERNEQTRDSRAYDGSGWGFKFMTAERESYSRHLGLTTSGDYVENNFRGMDSKLDPCGIYDTVSIKVRRSTMSQGFSKEITEYFRYQFVIPEGSLDVFKDFFNAIAAGNPEAGNI